MDCRLVSRNMIQLFINSKHFCSNGSSLTKNKKVGCLVFTLLNKISHSAVHSNPSVHSQRKERITRERDINWLPPQTCEAQGNFVIIHPSNLPLTHWAILVWDARPAAASTVMGVRCQLSVWGLRFSEYSVLLSENPTSSASHKGQ